MLNEFSLIIVPEEDESEGASVYIEGTIGGRPYRFLFDTGAGKTSVVHDEYTDTFGAVEKRESSGTFAKHADDLIIVPRLEIGPLVKENVTLARMGKGQAKRRNFLGMDLLKEFSYHFLFDENRVLVVTGEELEGLVTIGNQQSLWLDKANHPYLEVLVGVQKANVVWDTGASITVADMNFVQRYPEFFQQVGHSVGTDSTGATMETPMFLMSEATMGDRVFPPHKVAGVDLSHINATIERPMDLILGYNTICKANWVFDFPGKRWGISKWLGG